MIEETAPFTSTSPELVIPVDPEPTSLRTLLLVTLIVGSVVGYFVAQFLVSPETACSPLALILGVAFGAGIMRLMELILRPRWSSNKFVDLCPTEILIVSGGKREHPINPNPDIDVHMWYFTVKRATRVPKGWYVVCLALEDDDYILPVYSLMSPERFDEMPRQDDFKELVGKKNEPSEDRASLRVAGQQRRLLRAEGARDLHGVEMTYENFILYMQWLEVHFPEWLPVH